MSGVSGLVLDGIRPQTFLLKRFEGHKWSIAHIAFLAAQEILDQREVRDRGFGHQNSYKEVSRLRLHSNHRACFGESPDF